jgi:putative transposase
VKIKRSSKCTFKFSNSTKLEQLKLVLTEYGQVANFFIDYFWEHPTSKAELLKPIVDLPDTWLTARARKVAAREALDMISSAKRKAEECNEQPVKPTHRGKRMHVSSTMARFEVSRTKEFDGWLHLYSLGNRIVLDLPLKGHKHLNKLMAQGKFLQSYIITEDYVQFCLEIETGPKLEQGEIVGIDTGINALASENTGKQYGLEIKQHIERVKRCPNHRNLGCKGKGNKRAIRALKQYIDETAKEVVENKRLVVVEKLRKMNNKTKLKRRLSKNMRRSLGAWNYRYWLMRVEAACEAGRSCFRSVAPQYTSQRCHACGHTERSNRSGESFKCKSCDYTCNADINAAKNILDRFLTGPYGAGFKPKNLSVV